MAWMTGSIKKWIKYGGTDTLDLLEQQYNGTSISRISFSASVPNFLQIYLTATKLWALNWIQYGNIV